MTTPPPNPDHLQKILDDRLPIYGDPRVNHRGIAMIWAPLLEPWSSRIANLEPVPESTVALMMAGTKLCRARRTFHADNFDDGINYLNLARAWQPDHPAPPLSTPIPAPSAVVRSLPGEEGGPVKAEVETSGGNVTVKARGTAVVGTVSLKMRWSEPFIEVIPNHNVPLSVLKGGKRCILVVLDD